jgi:creatinine amidohydrolase
MRGPRLKYRYDHYTWVEIREIVKQQPVVILPVGSTEDHGYHLPLDVDNFLSWEVCEEAARRAPDEMLLLPQIPYGFEDHHMDFPGTITVTSRHMMDFVIDITKSVARHGFKKILIVDGHGSNMPLLDLAARQTVVETDAHCGLVAWWSLDRPANARILTSDVQSHADEIETAVYLHLNTEAVQMDKAVREEKLADSRFYWRGSFRGKGAPPLLLMDHWSRLTASGVIGDATAATVEKGKQLFEAAVEGLVELVREYRALPIDPRVDRHRE